LKHYIVVASPKLKSEISTWFEEVGCKNYVLVDADLEPSSVWAQDPFIALQDASGGSHLYLDPKFAKISRWWRMAKKISRLSGIDVSTMPYSLHGGNILGGAEVTLVGEDTIARIATAAPTFTRLKIITDLEEFFGTEVVAIGGARSDFRKSQLHRYVVGFGSQPVFHVDMFITRTGVKGSTGKEIVFLGRPVLTRQLLNRWSEIGALDHGLYDSLFEESECQLQDFFEVRYLPLLLTSGCLDSGRNRRGYILSFNNCLVDWEGNGSRRALLPNFSQDSFLYGTDRSVRMVLEKAAHYAWEQLGFKVKASDGLEDLAYENGGLHCMVKVVKRVDLVLEGVDRL
jgi:hypothetical protein